MTASAQAMDKPLKFREWRLGGAALGTHDPAPAKPCPGAYRYASVRVKRPKNPLEITGAVDRDGIYLLAGLSENQAKVAELHYERRLQPLEIAFVLNWRDSDGDFDGRRASVHLYKAKEKLRELGERLSGDVAG